MIWALLVVPHLSVLTTCSDDRKPYMILKALDVKATAYTNHIAGLLIGNCYHPSNW